MKIPYTELWQGDCFDVMPNIPNHSVNLILCDLPSGRTRHEWDRPLDLERLWQEYLRILAPNGCIALYADGMFLARLMLSKPKLWRYNLVWDKVLSTGFLNAKKQPLRRHEEICIFYRKPPTYNPQFTEGQPLHSKGTACLTKNPKNRNYNKYKVFGDTRVGSTQKYPTSILRFQKPHPSKAVYAAEKSVECNEWLIRTYTNPGDTVLDNCMGSGTAGIAAVNTGRNFIGIEKRESTFEIASRRIHQAQEDRQ